MTEPKFNTSLKLDKSDSNSATVGTTSKKKEGNSLFSSMLANAKQEVKKDTHKDAKNETKEKVGTKEKLDKDITLKGKVKEHKEISSKTSSLKNEKLKKNITFEKDLKLLDSKKENKHISKDIKSLKEVSKPQLKSIKDLSLKDLQDIKNIQEKKTKSLSKENLKGSLKGNSKEETLPDLKNLKDLKDLNNLKNIPGTSNTKEENIPSTTNTKEENTSKKSKSLLEKMLDSSREKLDEKSKKGVFEKAGHNIPHETFRNNSKISNEDLLKKTEIAESKPKPKEDLDALSRAKIDNLLVEVQNPKEELQLEKKRLDKKMNTKGISKTKDFAKLEKEEEVVGLEIKNLTSEVTKKRVQEKNLKNIKDAKNIKGMHNKAKDILLSGNLDNIKEQNIQNENLRAEDSKLHKKTFEKDARNTKYFKDEKLNKTQKKENLASKDKPREQDGAFASSVPVGFEVKNIKNNDLKHNKNDLASKLQDSSKNIYKDGKNTKLSKKESIDPLSASIYMQSQAQRIKNEKNIKKEEGLKLVKHGHDKEDVRKGAKILELNPQDLSMKQEEAKSLENTQKFEKDKFNALNNAGRFNPNIKTKISHKANQMAHINADYALVDDKSLGKNSQANSQVDEKMLSLDVSPSANKIIENKIIGARQGLDSMLSSLAKDMYENYKPPLSAFRINLNPSRLGSIAIIIKSKDLSSKSSNKAKDMSISLSLSSSATMGSLMAYQEDLKSALRQNFSNNDNFSLNFSMQEGNKEQGQRQNFSDSSRDGQENLDSQDNQDLITPDKPETSAINNYM